MALTAKCAILMATYNGSQYLRPQLNSIFESDYSDFTLFVHDDGSTDDTATILFEYAKSHEDNMVILKGPATGSAKANFLWMLSQVEADSYLLCDQDDVWDKSKIGLSLEILAGYLEKPACVFTDMYVVDEHLNKLSDSFIRYIGRDPLNTAYTQILIDNPAAGCTMCFNRALRDIAVGDYDIDLSFIPMHDAYILELASIFGSVHAIDKPLVYYRQTGHNTMGARTEDQSDKVSRNLSDVTSGSMLDKKTAFIMESRLFAREIIKVPDIPTDKLSILQQFVDIGKKSKLKRMEFYRKNNFSRAHHSFWMRLWV